MKQEEAKHLVIRGWDRCASKVIFFVSSEQRLFGFSVGTSLLTPRTHECRIAYIPGWLVTQVGGGTERSAAERTPSGGLSVLEFPRELPARALPSAECIGVPRSRQ